MANAGVAVNTVLYHPSIGMGEGPGYLKEFPAKREELQAYYINQKKTKNPNYGTFMNIGNIFKDE